MDAAKRGTSKVPSLPPPRPKSPPEYPDLYGKRRELAKVQMLEREIGFLEEELKSVERIQPASRSCKEVTDFVVANSDPLVTTNRKIRRSRRFWKWLCGKSCFNLSWICCCGCCTHLKMPSCSCSCSYNLCSCKPCACCSIPKCRCCCWPCSWPCSSKCCNIFSCSRSCCICQCPSCPDCSCSKCTCSTKCTCCCPKCPKVPRCSCSCVCARCIKNCCYSCCLCY